MLLYLNVSPGEGLILWSVVSLFLILLPVLFTISILRSNRFILTEKLLWLLVIWLVPVVGVLAYLVYNTTAKSR